MKRILIIGSGDIALQYVLALRELGDFDIDVLSRTFNSASDFCKIHSLNECYGGGIDSLPSIVSQYTGIIIASPIDTLLPYLRLLLDLGFTKILVEKPLALNSSDILPILSMDKSSSVMVALNRLFFPSYVQLRSIVADDPIRSLSFSFTEWLHRIDINNYTTKVLEKWGVSNCIHVISTVFDLIGQPKHLSPLIGGVGDVQWHPSGSIYKGTGISSQSIPFSYDTDWLSSGRWSITVSTRQGSYHLEPMESLLFTKVGTLNRQSIIPAWDDSTKCGFVPMLDYWLNAPDIDSRFSMETLREHIITIENIMYSPKF